MSVLTLQVDEVMRTLSNDGQYPFVVNDKTVDIVRFALNTGFTDVVLDEYSALRVMYQRPGETEVRAQTLTYYDTDGLYNYYDWKLSQSDLAKNGSLMVALCILRTDSEVEEWHTTPCQISVLNTIHTDDSDEADETITPTVAERVAVLETMIQRVASGAPIVVTSTSAMTDTDQIYVLSTDGNWYYHNGTTWVSGGTYGAVATDTTLTQSGIPADAGAVGNAINEAKADLAYVESGYLTYELVPNSYVKTNGDIEAYSGWSRTDYIPCTPNEKIAITFPVDSTYCQWYKSDKTSAGQLIVRSGTHIYTAPTDAEYFIVSHANANMANLKIRQLAKYSELLDLDDDVKTLKYYLINKDAADSVLAGYINPTTGAIVSSSSYDVYLFKNIGYENVECTTTLTTGCGAMAFYSSDEPTAESLLSVIPIKASGAVRSYSENVPSGTKLIAVGNIRSYTAVSIDCLLPFEEVCKSAVFGSTIEKTDIATLNKDVEYIVESSSAYNGVDYDKAQHKYFTVLLGSDIHRDVTNYNRMIDYAKQCNVLDAVFVPGDFNASHFNENGFEETYVSRYQDLEIPTLLVMGNHDVGDSISKEIYKSTTPNTVEGCTSRFITPYMAYNDCVQGSGGYYYRDFEDCNIRVIALNEYELPRIDNPNNNSKYLYNYWNRYISQTQANWLVSTLNSVPNGYGVIVLMHQMVDQITEYTDNKFNNPNYAITNGDHMTAQGTIIQDIIDAYMTRSTLSKTYANTLSAPSTDIPDVTVSANFSNSNGEFICYICGHTHADKIGQSSLATQKQVVEVANTASTTKAYYDDLWRQVGTKSQDCLNLLVFDTDKKKIRILRIGANSTLNMEWRDMTSISYT